MLNIGAGDIVMSKINRVALTLAFFFCHSNFTVLVMGQSDLEIDCTQGFISSFLHLNRAYIAQISCKS